MFSSRLRNTSEWKGAISDFIKSPSRWKETTLSNHDVEFPFSSKECKGTFRLLLMSTRQGQHSEMKQKISSLADQDCVKKGVMLLLQGGDAMSVWMELQMHLLQHNGITVMPLSNCQELVPAIESLRSQCNSATVHCDQGDEQVLREDMIRNCVLGHPLSNHKFSKLMSCVKGLSDLAAQVKTEEGRETICNALGKEDGLRLVAYFQDGPKPL